MNPSAAILMVNRMPVVRMFSLINAFRRTLLMAVTIMHTDSKADVHSIEVYLLFGSATLIDFPIVCFSDEII